MSFIKKFVFLISFLIYLKAADKQIYDTNAYEALKAIRDSHGLPEDLTKIVAQYEVSLINLADYIIFDDGQKFTRLDSNVKFATIINEFVFNDKLTLGQLKEILIEKLKKIPSVPSFTEIIFVDTRRSETYTSSDDDITDLNLKLSDVCGENSFPWLGQILIR